MSKYADRILYTERHLWQSRCPDCGQPGRTAGCIREGGWYTGEVTPAVVEAADG